MKKNHLLSWQLFTLLLISTPFSLLSDTNENFSHLSERVDTLFTEWDNKNSPGCALAVIKDGQIIYKCGYGMADLEHDIPISPNTAFYIGSISKQFVAMCMLLLEGDGHLSLDDDVRKYLPDFPEYGAPIEIHHLIHHTSGIRDYFTLWELAGNDYLDDMPEEAVYELICRQKELNFSTGEERLYSNSGYFLLYMIIERVTGRSLKEYAREKIFKPLKMNNSHFHDDNKHVIKNRAFGYTELEGNEFGNMIMRFDLVGSGGLYTTVEDLYLWDQNFYNNKLGTGGLDLIAKMLRNGRLNNGEEVNYAFALINGVYRGATTVSHNGALGGYRAQLLRFPDLQFSVIILSNLESFDTVALAYQIADIYLDDQFKATLAENRNKENSTRVTQSQDDKKTNEKKTQSINLSQQQLNEYSGEYYSDELLSTYKITTDEGKLFLQIKYNSKRELIISDKDVIEGFAKIVFSRDVNHKVSGFTMDAGRIKNIKFYRK